MRKNTELPKTYTEPARKSLELPELIMLIGLSVGVMLESHSLVVLAAGMPLLIYVCLKQSYFALLEKKQNSGDEIVNMLKDRGINIPTQDFDALRNVSSDLILGSNQEIPEVIVFVPERSENTPDAEQAVGR